MSLNQGIHDVHVDILVAYFPVVADGLRLFPCGGVKREVDDLPLIFFGGAVDQIPAAQRLVVVCRQGVFFFKLNSVFTEIGADILLDSFCQLVAKEGQCPLPLLGQAVAGVVVHGLGGNHIRVFQIA